MYSMYILYRNNLILYIVSYPDRFCYLHFHMMMSSGDEKGSSAHTTTNMQLIKCVR